MATWAVTRSAEHVGQRFEVGELRDGREQHEPEQDQRDDGGPAQDGLAPAHRARHHQAVP